MVLVSTRIERSPNKHTCRFLSVTSNPTGERPPKTPVVQPIVQAFTKGVVGIPRACLGSVCIMFQNFQKVSTREFNTKQKYLEVFFQMMFTYNLPLLYPAFCVAKKISDLIWQPVPLEPYQKASLLDKVGTKDNIFFWTGIEPKELESLVDKLEVVKGDHSLFHTIVLRNRAAACMIENTIYLRGVKMTDSLLKHEVTHYAQFQKNPGKFVGFLSVYFAQYLATFLTNGLNGREAYFSIEAEKQAYELEQQFGKHDIN